VDETQGWQFAIPQGIRGVISKRLTGLSDECNRVLTIASVIGREFGLNQLDRLIENISEDRLLLVAEEAMAAGAVDEALGVVDRYRFSHALIQETLVSELSVARRVRLHARVALALGELYGADVEDHAAQLAYHAWNRKAGGILEVIW
jgi:predicted ATPase